MIFTKSYCHWYRIDQIFIHHLRDIKCACQRANKGYCFRDIWNIDSWFIKLMPTMLEDFKKHNHGYPNGMTEQEWDKILNKMILLSKESMVETCSEKNQYEDKYSFKIEYKKLEEKPEFHTVEIIYPTKEDKKISELYDKRQREIEQYMTNCQNEFLDMFKKYFNNLWS